jgi:hypothetical protein
VLSKEGARLLGDDAKLNEAQYVAIVDSTIAAADDCHYPGSGSDAVLYLRSYDHDVELFEMATGKSLGKHHFPGPTGVGACPATRSFDSTRAGLIELPPSLDTEDKWLRGLSKL